MKDSIMLGIQIIVFNVPNHQSNYVIDQTNSLTVSTINTNAVGDSTGENLTVRLKQVGPVNYMLYVS